MSVAAPPANGHAHPDLLARTGRADDAQLFRLFATLARATVAAHS